MTATQPRRRVLRPLPSNQPVDAAHTARVERRRNELEKERISLTHWMSRLKRAFHAVERQQRRMARLERHLAQLEHA